MAIDDIYMHLIVKYTLVPKKGAITIKYSNPVSRYLKTCEDIKIDFF
jgi:hypothetical protein